MVITCEVIWKYEWISYDMEMELDKDNDRDGDTKERISSLFLGDKEE